MGVFDRGIRGNVQSPFTALGDAGTVGYSNPRLPQAFGGNVQLALDALLDSMYPNYKGTVAHTADLPTNALVNDYYIVTDDGDGKPAGYVYSNLGGVTWWNKRYDVDWSYDGLLAAAVDATSAMYVAKYGSQDRDQSGNLFTGNLAGQHVHGGKVTGESLVIYANATKDSTGAVRFASSVLPLSDNAVTLGNSAFRFQSLNVGQGISVGQTNISDGSLEAANGSFEFVATKVITTEVQAGTLTIGSTVIQAGSIVDSNDNINFGGNNLTTMGAINAQVAQIGNLQIAGSQFSTTDTSIGLGGVDVNNIQRLSADNIYAYNKSYISGVFIGLNTISTNSISDTLNISTGPSGGSNTIVQMSSTLNAAFDVNVSGTLKALGSASVATTFSVSNVFSITKNVNDVVLNALTGNMTLQAVGQITAAASVLPDAQNTRTLGSAAFKFSKLFLGTSISDGTTEISVATLQSLRDINTGATEGMALFYTGGKWTPSIADSEIQHNTLSGLTTGDAGHTQFAMLTGRTGGQTIQGGTAAGQNLTLDSTANATKGLVQASSILAPLNDASLDFGTSAKQWKDVYTTGVFKGLRFDSYAGSVNYPANSSAKIGRAIFDTTTNQVSIDTGTAWAKVGNQKFVQDVTYDGSAATSVVDISASIADARTALWQIADNTNNFERVYLKMTFTQTQVTITWAQSLASGSYRLIGFN